jgi:hypothetical protein
VETPQKRRPQLSLQTRLESLKERHADLEIRITDEDARPRPDADVLIKLKLEKLRIKEEIERLRTQPVMAHTA